MPCKSYWDDEDYLRKEINDLNQDNSKKVEIIKKMKDDIDVMTRSFCKITNMLFDHNPDLLIEFLLKDKELLEVFQEHQKVDKRQGRNYIELEIKPSIKRIVVKETTLENLTKLENPAFSEKEVVNLLGNDLDVLKEKQFEWKDLDPSDKPQPLKNG